MTSISVTKQKSNGRLVCCVPGCESRLNKDNVSFHYLPKAGKRYIYSPDIFGNIEKIDQLKAWAKVLKLSKTTPSSKVCSLHFKKDDYILPDIHAYKRRLKKNALPSCNLPNQKVSKCAAARKLRLSLRNNRKKENVEKVDTAGPMLQNNESVFLSEFEVIDGKDAEEVEEENDSQRDPLKCDVEMGKRRSLHSSSQGKVKIEVKDEIPDSEVHVARDRLKGALKELLHHSDEGSSAESSEDSPPPEYKQPVKKMQKPSYVQQKPKIRRRRPLPADPLFHHTYVMKLFDRSVDLAQFKEDTPLYPICRAWMANQPRNPNLVPKIRSPSPEIVNEVHSDNLLFDDSGELRDVYTLPTPLPREEIFPKNRIPSPIPTKKEKLNLDYDAQVLRSREALMQEHGSHWFQVRKKWHHQAHKNEQRFRQSANILSTIFKRAQSEFE